MTDHASVPTEAHSTERNKRWTELSALYVPNRQQWAELKQHVEWLYSQIKAGQVAVERDKYLCKLLVEWSIRVNDGEDHGSPAEHILRTLIKVADERLSPPADGDDSLDYKLPCEVRLPPATTFGVGVSLRTVVHALKRRTDQYPPKFGDSPDLSGITSPFQRPGRIGDSPPEPRGESVRFDFIHAWLTHWEGQMPRLAAKVLRGALPPAELRAQCACCGSTDAGHLNRVCDAPHPEPACDVRQMNRDLCAKEGHVLGVVARPCLRCDEWFDPQYGRNMNQPREQQVWGLWAEYSCDPSTLLAAYASEEKANQDCAAYNAYQATLRYPDHYCEGDQWTAEVARWTAWKEAHPAGNDHGDASRFFVSPIELRSSTTKAEKLQPCMRGNGDCPDGCCNGG